MSERERFVAKRIKKNDAGQKNNQRFDSARKGNEFSPEFGSAEANQMHKEKAKQRRADEWHIG